jgi:hypothetical protein
LGGERGMILRLLGRARAGKKPCATVAGGWLLPWIIDSYGILASAGTRTPKPFVYTLLENISRMHLDGLELELENQFHPCHA